MGTDRKTLPMADDFKVLQTKLLTSFRVMRRSRVTYVALSYETVREWCPKFGQTYANGLRRKSPRPGDRWHLDEVFLKINGQLHYLWCSGARWRHLGHPGPEQEK
jgi:hypothetical protein